MSTETKGFPQKCDQFGGNLTFWAIKWDSTAMQYTVYMFEEVDPLLASILSAVLSPTDLLPWLLKFSIIIEKSDFDKYKWRFFNHYLLKAKRNCSYCSISSPKSPAAVFRLMNNYSIHIWEGREMDTVSENFKRRPHGSPMRQDNIKMDGTVWTGSLWVGTTISGKPLLTQF